MGNPNASLFVPLCGALVFVSCSGAAPPRPQLVIVVDTNLPTVDYAVEHPDRVSFDAAIDTLRVDAISDRGEPFDYRDFTAPDPRDWPISFGIATPAGEVGKPIYFRVRAFRGKFASSGVLHGASTLEPKPEVTVDRLVQISSPEEGVQTVLIVLDGDCLGTPSKYVQPWTTCVDVAHRNATPSDGITTIADRSAATSRVGRSTPHVKDSPRLDLDVLPEVSHCSAI